MRSEHQEVLEHQVMLKPSGKHWLHSVGIMNVTPKTACMLCSELETCILKQKSAHPHVLSDK